MDNNYFMGAPNTYRGYAPSYLAAMNGMPSSTNPMGTNNTNIVWAMGMESAKAYPVLPGKTVMLMDSEGPHFFIKSVDNNGYATMKSYSFQEDAPVVSNQSAEYVTKNQLDEVVAKLMSHIKTMSTADNAPIASAEETQSAEKPKVKNLL